MQFKMNFTVKEWFVGKVKENQEKFIKDINYNKPKAAAAWTAGEGNIKIFIPKYSIFGKTIYDEFYIYGNYSFDKLTCALVFNIPDIESKLITAEDMKNRFIKKMSGYNISNLKVS